MAECKRCGAEANQLDLVGTFLCEHCREIKELEDVSRLDGQLDLEQVGKGGDP